MKVLLVNKFHWLKGGSEKYYFELGELLKKHGHEVAYFSMEDEKNIKTGDKEYFVKSSDMNSKNITKALSVIYSRANKKKMEEALDDFKPDIVHLNNFQRQLSASIIKPCVKRNIPIVFTAHDAQAICPAITMMDSNKNPCEKCMGGKYMNCVKKSCIKDSKLKSLLGAIEGNYYRNKKIYLKKITHIITPSQFFKEKFISDGINEQKISVIHNFVKFDEVNNIKNENYALFFGRLSKEKGILNLLKAFKQTTNGYLYIAGEGPEEKNIKKFIKDNGIKDRVKMLGYLNEKKMQNTIESCSFVIIPSTCNENCPYSILESMAMGKPIIASNRGGIPELVEDNKNGFIYKYDDINDLSYKIEKLFSNEHLINEFSKTSRKFATSKYSEEIYYNSLIKIYKKYCK